MLVLNQQRNFAWARCGCRAWFRFDRRQFTTVRVACRLEIVFFTPNSAAIIPVPIGSA